MTNSTREQMERLDNELIKLWDINKADKRASGDQFINRTIDSGPIKQQMGTNNVGSIWSRYLEGGRRSVTTRGRRGY